MAGWYGARLRFERFLSDYKHEKNSRAAWRREMETWRRDIDRAVRKLEKQSGTDLNGLEIRVDRIDAELGDNTKGIRGAIHDFRAKFARILHVMPQICEKLGLYWPRKDNE